MSTFKPFDLSEVSPQLSYSVMMTAGGNIHIRVRCGNEQHQPFSGKDDQPRIRLRQEPRVQIVFNEHALLGAGRQLGLAAGRIRRSDDKITRVH